MMLSHTNRYPFEFLMDRVNRDLFQQEAFFQEASVLNIYEDDTTLTVLMKSSGLKKEDIDIHSDGRSLVIEWKKAISVEKEDAENKVILSEIAQSESIRRQVTFPHPVKEDSINASYNNGVLQIMLTKQEKTEPKKINIS